MKLIHGDCLVEMATIEDKSVDMILCDLPYGTTACKWDSVIPFAPLWAHYKRVIKDRGAIVLFGSQPFTSKLVCSAIEIYKHSWVWDKVRGTNFFAAKFSPLNNTEDVCVFSMAGGNNGSKTPIKYFPQGVTETEKSNCYGGGKIGKEHGAKYKEYTQKITGYPFKIIKFPFEKRTVHPTQKPVALLEYLIKTYTLEGEMVLDNCMGSGSTGIACLNTGRHFIGIEKDDKYFAVALERIANHPPAELCA